jgi:serine/threonine protein kinase
VCKTLPTNMLKKIGSGGYSNVHTDGIVAVKTMSVRHLESAVREVVFTRCCSHESIIKVTLASFAPGEINLTMPLYDCDLIDFAPRGLQDVVAIAYRLISAVEHIHSLGIIHSDIKRANVLVRRGPIPMAVLCDFGISLRENERVHVAKVQTVNYRAPEVNFTKNTAKYSTKIDIWSLGIVILEMIKSASVMNCVYGVEDSSIYAGGFFGIQAPTRKERLAALRSLKSADIVNAVMAFVGVDAGALLYKCGFVTMIALSLHPDSFIRSEARTLKDILGRIVRREFPEIGSVLRVVRRQRPQMLLVPPELPQMDEMSCIINIPIEVIGGCSVQCLQYAEHLYNAYIKKYGAARHEIKVACVYISSVTYCDSSIKYIIAIIDYEQLCSAINKIMIL